jgi:hypothetical protein
MRRFVLAAALLLALAGCRDDFFDPTPGQTGPAPTRLELVARNVQIRAGEANAVRIGFQPKDVAVHLRVDRSATSGRIIACPLKTIDDPIPEPSACLPDLPDGVREGLTLSGLGAVALVREGDTVTLGIRMEFEEAGRGIVFRLPVIPRPAGASVCKDNGCNPFLEVLPVRGGTFTATARWSGGTGVLEVLEGRVLARSFSSTGIPYRIAAEVSGPPPLSVTATLSSPSEFALALRNTSAGDLSDIEIEATWP